MTPEQWKEILERDKADDQVLVEWQKMGWDHGPPLAHLDRKALIKHVEHLNAEIRLMKTLRLIVGKRKPHD